MPTPDIIVPAQSIETFVARYKITTVKALAAAFKVSEGEAARVLRQLKTQNVLAVVEKQRPLVYYLSGDKHFSQQSVHERFAVLHFCTTGNVARMRITPKEFADTWPELMALRAISPAQQWWYLTYPRKARFLGRAMVDCGGEVEGICLNCSTVVKKVMKQPKLQAMVDVRAIRLVVLTVSNKADALKKSLSAAKLPMRVSVTVIPELETLGTVS